MFRQIEIVKFGGINSDIAPELTGQGEILYAADMLNLRIEEQGKLVNRNGYIWGLHVDSFGSMIKNGDEYILNYPFIDFLMNLGVVGIGEFSLEEEWWDTQKTTLLLPRNLMVYFVRVPTITNWQRDASTIMFDENALNEYSVAWVDRGALQKANFQLPKTMPRKYRLAVFLSPLTGTKRNYLVTSDYTPVLKNKGVPFADKRDWINYFVDGYLPFSSIDKFGQSHWYLHRELSKDDLKQLRSNWKFLFAPDISMDERTNLSKWGNRLPGYYPSDWQMTSLSAKQDRFEPFTDIFINCDQYQFKLVVADKINGDWVIGDDFNVLMPERGERKPHKITMKQNKRDLFDIHTIHLQLCYDDENDDRDGKVKAGLALYYYEPDKSYQIGPTPASNDISNQSFYTANFELDEERSMRIYGGIAGSLMETWINEFVLYKIAGELPSPRDTLFSLITTPQNLVQFTSLSRYDPSFNPMSVLAMSFLKKDFVKLHIYSNGENGKEYYDLFKKVKLKEEKWLDNQRIEDVEIIKREKESGRIKTDIAANVYVWEDYKLSYYRTNGVDGTAIDGLLRGKDRVFNKMASGIPKNLRLKEQNENEKEMPLGVWRYKFVWDYGNGNFSLPSTELLAPDIMWSPTKDEWVEPWKTSNNQTRPLNFEGQDFFMKAFNLHPPQQVLNDYHPLIEGFQDHVVTPSENEIVGLFRNTQYLPQGDYVFVDYDDENPFLGERGIILNKIYQLKKKLYKGINSLAGLRNFNSMSDILTKDAGVVWDFLTLIIISAGEKFVKLNNFIIESIQTSGLKYSFVFATEYEPLHLKLKGNRSDDLPFAYGYDYPQASIKDRFFRYGFLTIPLYRQDDLASRYPLFSRTGKCSLGFLVNIDEWENVFYSDSFVDSEFDSPRFYCSKQILLPIATVIGTDGDQEHPPYILHLGGLYQDAFLQFITTYFRPPVNKPLTHWTTYLFDVKDDFVLAKINGIKKKVVLPATLLRHTHNRMDYFSVVHNEVPSGVVDRMFARGMVGLKLLDSLKKDEEQQLLSKNYTWISQNLDKVTAWGSAVNLSHKYRDIYYYTLNNFSYPFIALRNGDPLYSFCRLRGNLPFKYKLWEFFGAGFAERTIEEKEFFDFTGQDAKRRSETYQYVTNAEAYLYAEGERALWFEQLSSIFPSSILFNAPRLGIRIKKDYVPVDAVRLLIFRTKASHQNDWDPHDYGLVRAIDIDHEELKKKGFLYFFDDVRDDQLDFGHKPEQYEGMHSEIHSSFVRTLNERVYFANYYEKTFIETPRTVKGIEWLRGLNVPNDAICVDSYQYNMGATDGYYRLSNFIVRVFESKNGKGFTSPKKLKYLALYENVMGQYSAKSFEIEVDVNPSGKPLVVGFALLPSSYDVTINVLVIFRSEYDGTNWGKYGKIGFVYPEDEGVFVDENNEADTTLEGSDQNYKRDVNDWLYPKLKTIHGPTIYLYDSSIRWTEPYYNNWIKEGSTIAFREGDGSSITGIEVIRGNLIVFKENAIGRYAVQAQDPPISRVDEVSNTIGCIAPKTLINVNNKLYFLSWSGFIEFNGESWQRADAGVSKEIDELLTNTPKELLRYATAGYNPSLNLIYLNIPSYQTWENKDVLRFPYPFDDDRIKYAPERQLDYGFLRNTQRLDVTEYTDQTHLFEKRVLGHVFVFDLKNQNAYKYGYQTTLLDYRDEPLFETNQHHLLKEVIYPIQNVRMYYANSLGELRSADIFPSRYYTRAWVVNDRLAPYLTGFYIESPAEQNNETRIRSLLLYPECHPGGVDVGNLNLLNAGGYDVNDNLPLYFEDDMDDLPFGEFLYYKNDNDELVSIQRFLRDYYFKDIIIPDTSNRVCIKMIRVPVRTVWLSPYFTMGSEVRLKRIRKLLFNLFSKGEFNIKFLNWSFWNDLWGIKDGVQWNIGEHSTRVASTDMDVNPLLYNYLNDAVQIYRYQPTIDVMYPRHSHRAPAGPITGPGYLIKGTGINVVTLIPHFWTDTYRKPIKFSVEISTQYKTRINSVGILGRIIHQSLP